MAAVILAIISLYICKLYFHKSTGVHIGPSVMIYCSLPSLLLHVFSTEVVTSTIDIKGFQFYTFLEF